MASRTPVYDIEDRPPLRETIPLGVQHLVAMLLGNITPPLLIAGALGLAIGDTALLLQMVFFMAGAATLVQAYPVGPVGGRIPVIMGTSIAFVSGIIAVTGVAGAILVLLRVVPKVGAVLATIPVAVIGGGGLIMFAMIFASGAAIIHGESTNGPWDRGAQRATRGRGQEGQKRGLQPRGPRGIAREEVRDTPPPSTRHPTSG